MDEVDLRPERLSDSVARYLEKLVLEGTLRAGDRLPAERKLAAELNVSRPSLREALQKLEAAGLVETRHGGGTFVRNAFGAALTDPLIQLFHDHPQAAFDFIELRATLEGMGAYHAALRGTDADRETLSEHFAAMERAHANEDPTEEAERDADFHYAIAEASHNTVLMHVMRGLLDLLRRDVIFNRMRLYKRPDARDVLLRQHRAIYTAIMARDAEAARAAAQGHMAEVAAFFRADREAAIRDDSARRRRARSRTSSASQAR
ncbi:Pyruvate dehydrogenase complex repressor [uncultured Defluviicoccus sp.]|uniref:Pyruvate dehydrogenase complex repressor n=1 Tax=metagenome TaxID=256318 RepID=A0A380T8R5_9ZZZZ|nr:Pyruvate dehydrogenase complex repressor [uncultured Defluviicoccus sp.]